jgi:hypothetical protein
MCLFAWRLLWILMLKFRCRLPVMFLEAKAQLKSLMDCTIDMKSVFDQFSYDFAY